MRGLVLGGVLGLSSLALAGHPCPQKGALRGIPDEAERQIRAGNYVLQGHDAAALGLSGNELESCLQGWEEQVPPGLLRKYDRTLPGKRKGRQK